MKIFLVILGVIAVLFGALLLLFPSDVVTSHYSTLNVARTEQIFERGWLPDILPPSTFNIRTSNNLDLNISDGEFSFVTAEWPLLKAKLMHGALPAPFVNWEGTVEKYNKNGFTTLCYKDGDTNWVFFCKPEQGYCEYDAWLVRKG
ncbi:MAG: hypothetical protein A2X85_11350 [Geobacteraceae bacterium GWF2_54_21]|nr:MAG: hypothetical protein A2X85_11350 [Geobacteraceae bacterium GWF2_54_21]